MVEFAEDEGGKVDESCLVQHGHRHHGLMIISFILRPLVFTRIHLKFRQSWRYITVAMGTSLSKNDQME